MIPESTLALMRQAASWAQEAGKWTRMVQEATAWGHPAQAAKWAHLVQEAAKWTQIVQEATTWAEMVQRTATGSDSFPFASGAPQITATVADWASQFVCAAQVFAPPSETQALQTSSVAKRVRMGAEDFAHVSWQSPFGTPSPDTHKADSSTSAQEVFNVCLRVNTNREYYLAHAPWSSVKDYPPKAAYHKWFAKLGQLASLKDGWDSYEAPAPHRVAIDNARLYLSTLRLFLLEPTRVESSVMGGVGITHRVAKRKVYIEFYNNGGVHALFSDGTSRMQTTPVGAEIQSYYRFIGRAREHLNG